MRYSALVDMEKQEKRFPPHKGEPEYPVTIHNAHFSWGFSYQEALQREDKNPDICFDVVVRGLSLVLHATDLLAVVGPPLSGKTTLLASIAQETFRSRGTLQL